MRSHGLLFLVLPILVLLVLVIAPLDLRADVVGAAEVTYGDLLEVDGRRFRLAGIDAPEPGQTCRLKERSYDCGRISATALMDLTAGVSVRCVPLGKATNGLMQATCYAGDYDLSEGMVYTGWALADPANGKKYRRLQESARKARRGLWRGEFLPPWEWRRQRGN